MEGTSQGWFQVTQKRKCRIKILTKDGYNAANINILLRDRNGYRDRINSIKGVTYNLVNNVVVETKLNDENIFAEGSCSCNNESDECNQCNECNESNNRNIFVKMQ